MKGVILAAGYGSRFLPGTKTIPKEMFPLIDTPAVDLIVREMVDSGIRDILIVTSRRKKSLEDYFDREVELEQAYEKDRKKQEVISPPPVNIFFLRQQKMAGTGDALLLVRPFVGDSPFVVAYPDDIQIEGPPLAGQLMASYQQTGKTTLAVQEIAVGDISRYGVIDPAPDGEPGQIRGMVEKPATGKEPSRMVGFGRYLYTPEIFPALENTRKGFPKTGEFTQTEAINILAADGKVIAKNFEGRLLDVGTPQGYLEAVVEYGLSREEFRGKLMDFLKTVVKREKG